MAFYKEKIIIPDFVSRKQIEKFFSKYYAMGRSVNFFFYLKCRKAAVEDEYLRDFYINCALRYCNYASTGQCDSDNPLVQKAHAERTSREHLKKLRGISQNKRLRHELTDEDRAKRLAYEKKQDVIRKHIRKKKSKGFIRFISVPMGGQNKKY